jgi:cellulose biosynthesis protein BcsQ
MGLAISFEARAGGQGKTTGAIMVATWLAKKYPSQRFMIINTDPQNDCAVQLGIDRDVIGDRCLTQYVLGEKTLREVLLVANSRNGHARPNLYYAPAGRSFAEIIEKMGEDYGIMQDMYNRLSDMARRTQTPPASPSQQFLKVLAPLKTKGPAVIIVDCPPSLGPLRHMVHHLADYAVVPVVPGVKEMAMTILHTTDITDDLDAGARARTLAILPNQFNSRLSLHQEFLAQLRTVYNGLVSEPIPSRTAVGQAAAMGYALHEVDPDNEVSQQYARLGRKIASLAGLPKLKDEE